MSNDLEQLEETPQETASDQPQLERGTYEIIQSRLHSYSDDLRERLGQLNEERRKVFGSIPTELISTQRITTSNNCEAQDIEPIGDQFIFGYNVHMGLKTVTELSDVFGVFKFEDGSMHEQPLDLIRDSQFESDFFGLYKYYKDTRFLKFHHSGPHLYMVFQVGKTFRDTKSFKFLINGGQLKYIDNRSDHEVFLPPQHDFKWVRTHRDLHRDGEHPHISIDDRVFVETVGGDLTIKIEDNTDDGTGIYVEPVEDPDQTLDDAECFYAIVGNIILLKIRPFKEDEFRYLVFNEKTQSARRLDSIADACVFLPEDHGLIFANGYYLQTGVYKTFENSLADLKFDRRIASSNGEDYLYVFYNEQTGHRVLLSYNMIEQEVSTPIICNGFSIFENGQMIYFKRDETPQKHHAMQIWQTPYVGESFEVGEQEDSYIFKIGNKEIVRAMSESHEVLNLIAQDDSYANLYVDLVKKSTDILDSYFWLAEDQTYQLAKPLSDIRDAATAAVDEFDKVVRVRKNTAEQFGTVSKAATDAVMMATSRHFKSIDDFVQSLAELRTVRGQVISLKELKYVDLDAVEALETKVAENSDRLSKRCVEFLLRDDALDPYSSRVDSQRGQIESLQTGVEAKKLDEDIATGAGELEMLIEIVSNLKIEDANQRTRIIDNISAIYSNLNQTRASLKKKSQELLSVEGAAEFNSQLKLISQAVVNYLDVCDSPDRCDEYLTKMMVQVEELEGKFAEFDEFIVQLAEKREEIYAAFDTRKLQLVEARNKRATALMQAADRIIKGIRSRVSNFESVDDINSYFASDLMIDKVRDIVDQLTEMNESVKVDDIQSRLKTVREDTVRQLRDKNELFVDGQNIIQFGKHKFSVNTQPLDLTTVIRKGEMYFHLSGTNYFEPVLHEELLATKEVWDQPVVSENRNVYRGEYLAYLMLQQCRRGQLEVSPNQSAEEIAGLVQSFMAPRYSEGYIKGVHDHDAALILKPLLELDEKLGLLKFSTQARAVATLFWLNLEKFEAEKFQTWHGRFQVLRGAREVFDDVIDRDHYVVPLSESIHRFQTEYHVGEPHLANEAAEYLFEQYSGSAPLACSRSANELYKTFNEYLDKRKATEPFHESLDVDSLSMVHRFALAREWVALFVAQDEHDPRYIDEVAVMLIDPAHERTVIDVSPESDVPGLLGDHPRVEAKTYHLDYNDFMIRLNRFANEVVPAFEAYGHLKKEIIDLRRDDLKLEEFKPRVLTSFVRNKLINDTYLPMVGANLAKQIGVVGEDKRTDLMGLLLLVSPPGYGKTTLMEYIANRLGITFMKINGPAIGHQVTSLDPAEAPNASAREEVEKLNLALEMGDNVMIYLDDIQHCNPEFLQKFISLCDATRRIEGVFNGRTRTYDLRGRKVAVVMAGNPYTESGEKFQIPDMLASRADTYNLGDVIGDNSSSFELSYLENCLTSNSTLARLNSRSRNDVYSVIKMAELGDSEPQTLEGNYSIEEINEFVAVMKKLLVARDVILNVNREYIDSAAQADEFRTEPAFKLQGSYRDMNKIAEQLAPIMNDEELETVIDAHYLNQAQTLTSGAQANLLKLKELRDQLAGEDLQRWEDIKRTFKRNLMLGAAGDDGQLGQVIAQLTTFSEGLYGIQKSLDKGMVQMAERQPEGPTETEIANMEQIGKAIGELSNFNQTLSEMKTMLDGGLSAISSQAAIEKSNPSKSSGKQKIEVINKVPNIFLDIIRNQFRVLQTWMEPILKLSEVFPEAEGLRQAARATQENYDKLINQIGDDTDKRTSE
ncbi:MAG: DNA repair ATPase [Planctomycetota bacterium]